MLPKVYILNAQLQTLCFTAMGRKAVERRGGKPLTIAESQPLFLI